MRAGLYVRLSKETAETTSPARQRAIGEARIAERGYQFDPERDLYEDIDISAFSGARRPAFDRLMGNLARYDVIVFWRLDRIARSVVGFGKIWETCRAHDVALMSATEPFDTTTPIGEAMVWIAMVFAQLESQTVSLRIRSAQEHVTRDGSWWGGSIPFGWRLDKTTRRLILEPGEADLLRTLANRVLAGESARNIVHELNERGVPSGAGGQRWLHKTLLDRLRSPLMIGQSVRRGEIQRDPDGIPFALHEPLLDPWTYRRLVHELDRRRVSGRRLTETLLSGVLRCGRCGGKLAGSGGVAPSASYRCRNRQELGVAVCEGVNVSVRAADRLVGELIEAVLTDDRLEQARRQARLEAADAEDDPNRRRAEQLRQGLDRLEHDRYHLGLFDGFDGEQRFAERYKRLADELAVLESAPIVVGPSLVGLVDSDPVTVWRSGSLALRRSILEALVERITVAPAEKRVFDPDRLDVVWR